MVAVAIAAVHFGAMRALFQQGLREMFLLLGALPMADVLIVGFLIARQPLRSRPFLLGFEVFGAIALAVYILLTTLTPSDANGGDGGPLNSYASLVLDPLRAVIGPGPLSLAELAIEWFVGLLMLVGPQLVFALIGGFLSHSFKVTSTLSPRR
jgi:hypothetical protein